MPEALRLHVGQLFLTPGREYEVHATVVYEGRVSLLIVDDLGQPTWNIAWLFDSIDSALPADWICSVFPDEPSLVLGPDFIARTRQAYESMVELAPEQVERFWKRVRVLKAERDAAAANEWRELGFSFMFDEASRRWLVIGSRTGLRRFCLLLTDYASDPKHHQLSAQEHYGPYMDLKVVTWHSPQVRNDGLYGRLEDFSRLAKLIEETLLSGQTSILLGSTFMEGANPTEADLELRVVPDHFDPAAMDA